MQFLESKVHNNDIILIKCSNATEINEFAKKLLKLEIDLIKYIAFEYQSLFSFLNIFSYITFRAGASISQVYFSL